MNCWEILGIEPTGDHRSIKRAYARLLKKNSPEDNPEGFQALRQAYESALEARGSEEVLVPRRPAPNSGNKRKPGDSTGREVRHDNESAIPPHGGQPDYPEVQAENSGAEAFFSATHHIFDASLLETEPADASHLVIEPIEPDELATTLVMEFAERLDQEGEDDALAYFREVMASEQMIHVDLQAAFEINLLEYLAFLTDGAFPGECAITISDYFGWDDHPRHLAEYDMEIAAILYRIECYEFHRNLFEKSQHRRPWYSVISTEEAWVSKILLGKYNPWKFRWISFSRSKYNQIKTMLLKIEAEYTILLDHELSTPTIQWWRQRIKTQPLHSIHIFSGFILGLVLAFAILLAVTQHGVISEETGNKYFSVNCILSSIFCTWLVWWSEKIRNGLRPLLSELTNRFFVLLALVQSNRTAVRVGWIIIYISGICAPYAPGNMIYILNGLSITITFALHGPLSLGVLITGSLASGVTESSTRFIWLFALLFHLLWTGGKQVMGLLSERVIVAYESANYMVSFFIWACGVSLYFYLLSQLGIQLN